MERPTCRTCPFWQKVTGSTAAECHRWPPTVHENEIDDDGSRSWVTLFPEPSWDDWCGEHPQFPAYLASLRSKPTPDEDPALNQAKTDYHRQRIAELEAEGR